MEREFVELVIEGPFILVKGFLMGFIEGTKEKPVYFFSRRAGIRTETLGEAFKEWLGFENIVHLCLEKSFAEKFSEAVKNAHSKIAIDIKSTKTIKSASFEFNANFYNKKQADKFKAILDNLDEGIFVDSLKEEKFVDEIEKNRGIYAPEHDFEYSASGKIVGNFDNVIELYLKHKKEPMIELSEVYLNFD